MDLSKVITNRRLSEHTFVLRVEKPNTPVRAGQCYSLGTENLAINREYSIYSGVNENYLEFLIREVEGGIVSPALAQLKQGDEVTLTGPFGEFCIDNLNLNDRNFLFIASGTGIAPFHSFIRTFPNIKYTILHGIRNEDERYDSESYLPESYKPCISKPIELSKSERVTDKLGKIDLSDKTIFLCGNKMMISDSLAIIRRSNLSGDRVFTETFF